MSIFVLYLHRCFNKKFCSIKELRDKPVDIRKKPIYNKNVNRQHNPEKSKSFLVRKSE